MTVLKKLAAFVPAPDDTVGSLEPAVVAAPAGPALVSEPRPARRPKEGEGKPRRRRALAGLDEALRTKTGGTDGRSLRRTGRTALMSVKVRPELPEAMKAAAYEAGLTLGELMDEMWAAWERRRSRGQGSAGEGS